VKINAQAFKPDQKSKSQQKERLREKRVQRGKTFGEGEGNADFCCGFLLPSLSLLHEVFLFGKSRSIGQ